MWQSVGITLLVILAAVVCALLFIWLGWYVVWQLFLSRFKFLRELIGEAGTGEAGTGEAGTSHAATQPSETKSQHQANVHIRSRPRTARQRAPEGTL